MPVQIRRILSYTGEAAATVLVTEKGYTALWVGFVVSFLSTAYFIRASIHSHSKVRGMMPICGRAGVRVACVGRRLSLSEHARVRAGAFGRSGSRAAGCGWHTQRAPPPAGCAGGLGRVSVLPPSRVRMLQACRPRARRGTPALGGRPNVVPSGRRPLTPPPQPPLHPRHPAVQPHLPLHHGPHHRRE
jgi:hypothetical protein